VQTLCKRDWEHTSIYFVTGQNVDILANNNYVYMFIISQRLASREKSKRSGGDHGTWDHGTWGICEPGSREPGKTGDRPARNHNKCSLKPFKNRAATAAAPQ